ncbi:MAG TPA: hypothetical protein VED85_08630, partial [Burkholderiaceae bacterium]|nr:hypothetical protein [Burkholderiaceae bacterium]
MMHKPLLMIGFERGALAASVALAFCNLAYAGGLLGIDHALTPTDTGIWARRYTLGLEYGVVAVGIGGAIWLG